MTRGNPITNNTKSSKLGLVDKSRDNLVSKPKKAKEKIKTPSNPTPKEKVIKTPKKPVKEVKTPVEKETTKAISNKKAGCL